MDMDMDNTQMVLDTSGQCDRRRHSDLDIMPRNEQGVHRAVMLGTVAYIFLLALPFVPGAEIGIALLTSFGDSIAPLVYAATVVAMVLSYFVGLVLPTATLVKLLMFLRIRQAADLIGRAASLPPIKGSGCFWKKRPPTSSRSCSGVATSHSPLR
jgi:hypothetical protein